jgi:hypothetical protein
MHFSLRFAGILLVALVMSLACLPADAQTSIQNGISADNQKQHPDDPAGVLASPEVTIPGPLRSFERMAGISQKVTPEQVLPLLARNVYVQGYVGWQDSGTPTEFLILLGRYINQSKELAALAGPSQMIHISGCADAAPLLRTLGYRLRAECGQKNASLITAEAERAFLTVDSGFPLPALEEALRRGEAFSYPYPSSRVPLLFKAEEWRSAVKLNKRRSYDTVELFLYHPALARLYWALSRIDPETRDQLRQSVGLKKLLPVAADLDFYGSQISIRSGRVQVPGGPETEADWKDLVGASPQSPGDFVPRLLAKDNGWLAVYFDSFSRISPQRQQRFSEAHRLKTYYAAFRTSNSSSDAARPAFRLAPGLLLLLTRLQWDRDGQPLVPGNLDLWKQILNQKSNHKAVRESGKRAVHWSRPEDLLGTLFTLSSLDSSGGPVQMYLLFSELDSTRAPGRQLSPETLRLLAKKFYEYSEQYLMFCEFPELDDASITGFVSAADAVNEIGNHTLRGNAMGTFQANIGLWQILARQGQIPRAKLNQSWQAAIKPFEKLGTSAQLFEAGRKSLGAVLQGANANPSASQDQIIDLIAGPEGPGGIGRVHQEIAKRIHSVMDGQRLVSLDTLLGLDNGLKRVATGEVQGSALLSLAGELREFEMPRPIFTSSERTEWAAGIYNNRHTELQMQTDLSKVLKSSPSRAKLEEARGQLAPFLRDTLVGLNYAYYEPPAAQLLRINPLFVRSHDFSGDSVAGVEGLWRAPELFGQGSPAGGGAHLVGSLADLAYVLSDAEQDFISPENIQALIWKEVVPGLLSNSVLSRWWNVSRNELHAVALYQRSGEELVTASASNQELRSKVLNIFSERMSPERTSWLDHALKQGHTEEAFSTITPADTFDLTVEFRRRFPADDSVWGASGLELDRLCRQYPSEVSWQRLSRDFGVPHRTLAQTYRPELLNLKPFPAFAGYSSRLMAESWESNNLYWARLADEMGYDPAMLNLMAPELTRRMVEKIFATEFEDWQALLRAMREAGEEFRQGKIAVLPPATTTARQFQTQQQ